MYYKKQHDGSISVGATIHGPDFTLTPETTEESHDGWKWFDAPEKAYSYFSHEEGSVSPRQIRLALLATGLSPRAITEALQDNEAALIEWEHASVIERSHPLIAQLGVTLGKSAEEIDNLFLLAKTL